METTKIVFTADDLAGCLEGHGFTSLPTDWCDSLFESDCHTVEVYRTPQGNMFRLLFMKRYAEANSGASIGFYIGGLVFSAEGVSEFVDFIRASEQC